MALTVREHLLSLNNGREVQAGLARGLVPWAVERRGPLQPGGWSLCTVLARSRSDALRRAGAPFRLGDEMHEDVTDARRFEVGLDDAFAWPFERAADPSGIIPGTRAERNDG